MMRIGALFAAAGASAVSITTSPGDLSSLAQQASFAEIGGKPAPVVAKEKPAGGGPALPHVPISGKVPPPEATVRTYLKAAASKNAVVITPLPGEACDPAKSKKCMIGKKPQCILFKDLHDLKTGKPSKKGVCPEKEKAAKAKIKLEKKQKADDKKEKADKKKKEKADKVAAKAKEKKDKAAAKAEKAKKAKAEAKKKKDAAAEKRVKQTKKKEADTKAADEKKKKKAARASKEKELKNLAKLKEKLGKSEHKVAKANKTLGLKAEAKAQGGKTETTIKAAQKEKKQLAHTVKAAVKNLEHADSNQVKQENKAQKPVHVYWGNVEAAISKLTFDMKDLREFATQRTTPPDTAVEKIRQVVDASNQVIDALGPQLGARLRTRKEAGDPIYFVEKILALAGSIKDATKKESKVPSRDLNGLRDIGELLTSLQTSEEGLREAVQGDLEALSKQFGLDADAKKRFFRACLALVTQELKALSTDFASLHAGGKKALVAKITAAMSATMKAASKLKSAADKIQHAIDVAKATAAATGAVNKAQKAQQAAAGAAAKAVGAAAHR